MNKNSKVAIIGLGSIGKTIASNLITGNREVIVAGHDYADAQAFASAQGDLACPLEVADAIKEADIVIFSVWFDTIQELFEQYSNDLKGKVIVDPSNPIAPDGDRGFKKIIGKEESAGEILNSLLPEGASLVKVFGTLGAESLKNAAFGQQQNAVLFYATDTVEVIPAIEQLVQDSGFDPVNVGGIENSIRLEVFGDLHEFGALGKTITKAEWEQK